MQLHLNARSNHVPVVHTLRGIAATAVCLYHFVSTTINLFSPQIQEVFHFGKFGVQMFFVISGFVIPLSMLKDEYKPQNAGQFLKKRFIRLEPTYLVSILLALAYVYARKFVPGSSSIDLTPSLQNVILHFGYMIPFFEDQRWLNPVYWTLAVEFQYYLLICLIFPLLVTSNKVIKLTTCILLCCIGLIITSPKFIFVHFPCFMFGISYALHRFGKLNQLEFMAVIIASALLLFISQGITILLVASASLLLISNFPNVKSKATNFLGDISYSLYLLHSIIGAAILNFLSHRVTGYPQKIAAVMVAFAASTIAAYLLYKLVEKPSHEFSKKIKLKNSRKNEFELSNI